MKSCFSSEMIITQKFANDFWADVNGKVSIYFIESLLEKGYEIYQENEVNYIVHNDKKIYIKKYYKSMGILGHDGLDVVPKNKKDLSVFNIIDGIVMIKQNHNAYGNRIAIWNQELKLTEYHNHLESFSDDIRLYSKLSSNTYIGKMGSTGKVFGAHNHLAYARTNVKADRINRENGFFGYIDPIPFLENGVY